MPCRSNGAAPCARESGIQVRAAIGGKKESGVGPPHSKEPVECGGSTPLSFFSAGRRARLPAPRPLYVRILAPPKSRWWVEMK